ncbi:MAG: ABC transporter permease [Candidatus Altiarchaeota archaeon]|nr:ABC transporter permease [Candidatus Altiarchaeota archaeon]
MIDDYFKFAIDGIRHRSLRSWLTMIGIFVGITAVVSLISLGQGLQATIDDQFQKVGGDRITVSPGGGGITTGGGPLAEYVSAKLDEKDLDVVRKVRGVEDAVGVVTKMGEVEYRDKRRFKMIFAFPTDIESQDFLKQMDFFVVDKGSYLKDGDKYKAIVGVETGDDFDKDIGIGDKLTIEGREFQVVGINKKSGNPVHDKKVTIPFDTAKELFNGTDSFSTITVKVKKGFEPSDVADDITEKLRKSRGVKEDEEDFSVETAENLIASFKNILLVVQAVITGIASISLLVGGIGIMTTMYTAILERTRQIGIMKSIGARNSDILMLFLIEAGLLGVVGGIIGIIFGFVTGKIVEQIAIQYGLEIFRAYFSIELVLGALLFSFMVGALSGILPAWRASRLSPVDALRYR